MEPRGRTREWGNVTIPETSTRPKRIWRQRTDLWWQWFISGRYPAGNTFNQGYTNRHSNKSHSGACLLSW